MLFRSMKQACKIVEFETIDDWLNACQKYGCDRLISPGGAANLVAATRVCVHNWIWRDHKIKAFIYDSPYDGKYILVDKNDVIRTRLGAYNKKINPTLAEMLTNQLVSD